MSDDVDFETALAGLTEAVDELEAGDLTLDEALERFETGVRHARAARAKLGEAEARVQELLDDGTTEPLE